MKLVNTRNDALGAIALLFVCCALLIGCQTTNGSGRSPLPSDIRFEQPGNGVAPELAAYSGLWRGKWENELDTQLAIEAIDPPFVDLVYSWGTGRYVQESGWKRITGRYENGILRASLRPGVDLEFRLRENDTISALYTNQGQSWDSTGTLYRVQ